MVLVCSCYALQGLSCVHTQCSESVRGPARGWVWWLSIAGIFQQRATHTHVRPVHQNSLRTAVSPSIGNGDDSMVAVPTGHCCRPTSGLALAVLIQLTNLFSQQGQHFRQKRLFQLLREGGVASWASALVTHGAWRYLPAPCVLWQRVCVLALGSIAARVGV